MLFLYLFLNTVKCGLSLVDTPKLIALDQSLTKLLIEPEPGRGNELLNEAEFLCKNLDEVSDLIDEKQPEGSVIYKTIKNAGGVKFVNSTYNPELLKETYKFSDDDLYQLKTTIRESKSIWKCIEIMLNVTLPDSGEHFHENMAAKIKENQRLRGDPETSDLSPFGTSEVMS